MNNEITKRIISSLLLVPSVFYCIIQGSYFFNSLIFIFFLITVYEWSSMVKKKKSKLVGLIFIGFSYITIFFLRNNFGEDSVYIFLMITLICISSDLGGYIFGKLLKGPKLTRISPNKTYSGFFGAIILSFTVSIIFTNTFNIRNYDTSTNDVQFLIIIILISVISQFGDLTVSYFKRLYNKKDTGKIIPGHGGILDRTDGMIFAFPFTYILLTLDLL